ncbi:lamin tail domain-containing protein [Halorussus halophilus]|uniref:lamin tail domain-containing protein n=1 Tax=Halorussus halophilus TaxID=2650975 RepID=UPI0013012AE2|nr:lamin tail domain-containing protein [Halorussus halophilus]
MKMSRRKVLASTSTALGIIVGGCTEKQNPSKQTRNTQSQGAAQTTQTRTDATTSQRSSNESEKKSIQTTQSTTSNSSLPPIYISQMVPNPKGDDETKLNNEVVTIEMNSNTSRDLSGYRLEYSTGKTYTFPDIVTDVPPNSNITIHSGSGENETSQTTNSEFTLHVGSETQLLSNQDGKVSLLNRNGEIVHEVSYSSVKEGEIVATAE